MTHRLLLFSEEETNFVMEILAPPTTTFLELHRLILDSCEYREEGEHTFLICNENWKVKEKIRLRSTDTIGYDEDLYLMDRTTLEDFIEEEGHHMAYVYDSSAKRTFIIELVENIFGETADKVSVSRQKGLPPVQFNISNTETPDKNASPSIPAAEEGDDEALASDEDFSEEEIDMDGFEVSEG